MAEKLPGLDDPLATLKASTPARIFLPSAGAALATKANLAFQLAHAQARDAVGDRLDTGVLAHRLRARGLEAVCVESAAPNRRVYLMRPDLGRRLAESARASFAACGRFRLGLRCWRWSLCPRGRRSRAGPHRRRDSRISRRSVEDWPCRRGFSGSRRDRRRDRGNSGRGTCRRTDRRASWPFVAR
jgi:Ethanolamine ammonia-lyase light chain (EutC)